MCSTPDGVKGFSTLTMKSEPMKPVMCSTPDGVKGFSTTAPAITTKPQACAQRLTASKDSPQPQTRRFAMKAMCSTPDGVKGFSTTLPEPLWAFGTCAQRLTASKDSPPSAFVLGRLGLKRA